MNIHAISSIARSRREELLREAAAIRSTRTLERRNPVRSLAVRAARAAGRACFVLGDALAGERGSSVRGRVL
jgi:hypothetical protein